MKQIITHFTDDDLYKFTMCCAVVDNYPRAYVKYRFFDRNNKIYPSGFGRELTEQIRLLEGLSISNDEIDFMRRRCKYIPQWFYTFLKGFRYDSSLVSVNQDSDGHLTIDIEGPWSNTILFEVKILAIVSELYYTMTGEITRPDYADFAQRTLEKGCRLINAGCSFSDFGTRRRLSFNSQNLAVEALKKANTEAAGSGTFVGTSNVYLAMEYDLTPIGTMAHELICAIAGMFGPQMANHLAMDAWRTTYRGALGTFLYDTYGWNIFSQNFSEDYANMFKGLRVDSGDNLDQLNKIVEKYRSLGIDPATKQIVFSNALSTDSAIALQQQSAGRCIPSFGIGTHFTNDFPGIEPMNIVMKLVASKITESWDYYNPTCKLSEDRGKFTGESETVEIFRKLIHY